MELKKKLLSWFLVVPIIYGLTCLILLFLGVIFETYNSTSSLSFFLVLSMGAVNILGVKTLSILYAPQGGQLSSVLFLSGSIIITSFYLFLTLYFIYFLKRKLTK